MSAAADLMYIHGVVGTSLADVMAASGTGTSQLYHYFADKEALVTEVVHLQIDRTLATQQRLLTRVDSIRGLRRWRDAEVQEARGSRRYGCPLGSLASELSCSSDRSRAALAAAFTAWQDLVVEAVRRIQARGGIDAGVDPVSVAAGLLSALQGGLVLAQTMNDPAGLERALDAAITGAACATAPPTAPNRTRR